jgi:ubiquinone/menaquinone biosynthesis C-methylase UbiE
MTADTATINPDLALKARHRAVWASGDYPAVAAEVVPSLGPILVDACRVGPGDTVLDVAAGTGNAALAAALTGATVVASDLTPELFQAGRARAANLGVQVTWQEADAEALPFDDDAFDVVLSSIGVMFAPHHQAAADELVRVCRPGGTIGMINWTPQGFIGQLFGRMKAYTPPPPPGAQPPPLWGSAEHVRDLFGDRVAEVTATVDSAVIDRFTDGEQFRDFFSAHYGPTVAAYRNLAGDPERVSALDEDLAGLARSHDRGNGVMHWDYLLWTGRRTG